MIKRILTFIKVPWVCDVVTKTVIGVVSALTVVRYIQKQVDGSEVGEKIGKILVEVEGFLVSASGILNQVSDLFCGKANVQVKNHETEDVDTALNVLSSISKELDDLKK